MLEPSTKLHQYNNRRLALLERVWRSDGFSPVVPQECQAGPVQPADQLNSATASNGQLCMGQQGMGWRCRPEPVMLPHNRLLFSRTSRACRARDDGMAVDATHAKGAGACTMER